MKRSGIHTALLTFMLTMILVGCAGGMRADMATAQTAFNAGDYQRAYDVSLQLVRQGGTSPSYQAAYMVGLSAYRLEKLSEAERLLKLAARTNLTRLRGRSLAMLGLVYADQGRFDLSSRTLSKAAEFVTGQDRAKAYFYAAISAQKLNRAAASRTLLVLASRYNLDPQMSRSISEKLSNTGYTIQMGVYANADAARSAGEQLLFKSQGLHIGYPRVEHRQRENGVTIHLLQIGRFSTFNAAAAKRHELGINDAVVVVLTSVK